MLGLRAADEPHAGHPKTPLIQGCFGRRDEAGVVGEPKVVVGAEVQDVLAARVHVRGLWRGELTLRLEQSGGLDLSQGRIQFLANGGVHDLLPAPVDDDLAAVTLARYRERFLPA